MPFPVVTNLDKHGEWIVLEDIAGLTHLSWKWFGGLAVGYLCSVKPEWFDTVDLPLPPTHVTCLACLGTCV